MTALVALTLVAAAGCTGATSEPAAPMMTPTGTQIPEPDCYQIRGYAVLEGTAKNFGGTAHGTVPRKYSGKRVKIVVLDP